MRIFQANLSQHPASRLDPSGFPIDRPAHAFGNGAASKARNLLGLCGLGAVFAAGCPAHAQVSLTTAVDLALSNNPRVKMAASEVVRARAALAETKDIYIPSVTVGAGLGQGYGYSPDPPTLFTANANSLVFNVSQFAYIRSARAGLNAAQLALADAREAVAEDAALTFVALDHDQKRDEVLRQQSEYVDKLVRIVSDRFDAGQDTQIDLTTAKLTAAQLRLTRLRDEDDTAVDRIHLQRIMGIPDGPLRTEGGLPSEPLPADLASPPGALGNPAVASAFANARAKSEQAYGDSRFLYRPQFSLGVQYRLYATFTNSYATLNNLYKLNGQNSSGLGVDEKVFGVQISLPLFDKFRQAKARESTAIAVHALHEAENARIVVQDAQTRLTHTVAELQARAEVAALEQQLAQQQLDVLQVQLNASSSTGPAMTPKDEQNQHIAERDKYLVVLETAFQLQQAEISLLRQTGRLEEWLRQAMLTVPPSAPSPVQPHP